MVESPSGPVSMTALQLPRVGSSAFLQFVAGDAAHAWPEFQRGAVLISEPLAWRLQLKLGDELPLSTAEGLHQVSDCRDLPGVWERSRQRVAEPGVVSALVARRPGYGVGDFSKAGRFCRPRSSRGYGRRAVGGRLC